MKNYIQVGTLDPIPLLLQLERHPELWNEHDDRTTRKITAHNEVSDIWLRYRPKHQLVNESSYNEAFHDMSWYPAYFELPEVRLMTLALMQRVAGTSLGGCLITKIPPGGQVKSHSDLGVWHAHHYNTKVYVPLKANAECINVVDDEVLVMRPGECWVFDNLKTHAVLNEGNDDRITLIVSIRCD